MATPTSLPATFVAGNVLTAAQMNNLRGAFRVLQVVTTTKTDVYTQAVNTNWSSTVTGLTASITPSSTSSKILVFGNASMALGTLATGLVAMRVMRDSTAIAIGDTAGNRTRVTSAGYNVSATESTAALPFFVLDSPNTTSAVVYGVQGYVYGNGTLLVNRNANDADLTTNFRSVSTITVMEISA